MNGRMQGSATGKITVIPLSPARDGWLVFHGAEVPEGPYPVVAIGLRWTQYRVAAEDAERLDANSVGAQVSTEPDMDFPSLYFLVLPADPATWETLWMEKELVFFGEAEAQAAAAERYAAWQAKQVSRST